MFKGGCMHTTVSHLTTLWLSDSRSNRYFEVFQSRSRARTRTNNKPNPHDALSVTNEFCVNQGSAGDFRVSRWNKATLFCTWTVTFPHIRPLTLLSTWWYIPLIPKPKKGNPLYGSNTFVCLMAKSLAVYCATRHQLYTRLNWKLFTQCDVLAKSSLSAVRYIVNENLNEHRYAFIISRQTFSNSAIHSHVELSVLLYILSYFSVLISRKYLVLLVRCNVMGKKINANFYSSSY